jgi:hypothetical protein
MGRGCLWMGGRLEISTVSRRGATRGRRDMVSVASILRIVQPVAPLVAQSCMQSSTESVHPFVCSRLFICICCYFLGLIERSQSLYIPSRGISKQPHKHR